MNTEKRKRLRELAEKATPGPWEAKEPAFAPGIGRARVFGPGYAPKHDGKECIKLEDAELIAAARTAVPALLDALDEAERKNETITSNLIEIIAPQCPEHESHFKRISLPDFIEKYPRRCAECERLERVAIKAENAALRARCERLEKVRKAAEEVSYKYSDDYSEDNLRWNELIGALADADALDRAGEP